jgi:IS4 transposase
MKRPLTEKDLGHWKLLRSFRQHLEAALERHPLPASWDLPQRELTAPDYLSLFLFGLLNPVTQTLRGLSAATRLDRVREEVCSRRVPRSTFSDAQHLLDPALLEKVFAQLAQQLPPRPSDPRLGPWQWLAHDGSLFGALPRMSWALYGGGRPRADGHRSCAVRLHLSLHVLEDKPVRATVRPGTECERAVWREHWEKGAAYLGDRLFAQNYRLLSRLEDQGCAYVLRLREAACITVEEELPVSQEDRAERVQRQAWVRLGQDPRKQSGRVRVVWIQGQKEPVLLVTNLGVEALSAALVSQLYRKRWKVELFFRWVKCILGCGHWLAESQRGATLQIYLALIAALLLQLYTGRRPTRRMMELIRWYLMGMASGAELEQGLEQYRRELERRKKS